MKIADRTFIISGGASGLGLATARDLHAHGAYVSLLDLNGDAGAETVSALGSRAKFFEFDVSDTDSIAKAIEGTVAWVKETGKAIGGVVAGAGVGLPGTIIDKKNEPLPISSIDFVLNINLRGTLDLIRQALPYMTTNEPDGPDGERGVIIMIASSAAFDGQMGQVAYAASKGAVAALTLPLARDLSRFGIRAVTIAPSLFDSNMTKMMSAKVKQGLVGIPKHPTSTPLTITDKSHGIPKEGRPTGGVCEGGAGLGRELDAERHRDTVGRGHAHAGEAVNLRSSPIPKKNSSIECSSLPLTNLKLDAVLVCAADRVAHLGPLLLQLFLCSHEISLAGLDRLEMCNGPLM